MNRISGPLLDRIDLHVDVQRVRYEDISKTAKGESSAQIKARVMSARNIQQVRFQGTALICNADMERKHVQEWCKMQFDAEILLAEAFKRLNLSARAHDRLLKVARTIADLAGENMIGASHIAEAVQYRSLDRLVRA
jgi:magnesium chelatase family protein